MGDAFGTSILVGVFIVDVECVDDFTVRVGEQRVGDLGFFAKFVEDIHLVVANGDNLDFRGFDLADVLLQLNQLLDTERSPAGGTVKNQGHFVALVQKFLKAAVFAGLILQREDWCFFAHLQASFVVLRRLRDSRACRSEQQRAANEKNSHASQHFSLPV
jgi:hypothetical protein